MIDFNSFKDTAMLILLSGGLYILRGIKESVDALNINVAVIIEKTNNHEKRIEKLEDAS